MIETFAVASPIGRLRGAVTPQGLALLTFPGTDFDAEVARLSGPRRENADHVAARELREYFSGARRRFDVPVDLALAAPFARRVLERLRRIPFGATTTYGALARDVGSPGAARAVGGAVGSNPVAIVVPCHRVLAAHGLGGFGGGLAAKRALLRLEGVALQD